MTWRPTRSLAEADAILCGPGMPHQLESRVIDGRVYRVYKNLWPSLRVFWLWAANQHKHNTYVVLQNQRPTYADIYARSLKAAAVFRDVYAIAKGDRVAICSRNIPDYLSAWWAAQLIAAVPVLVNAWLPLDTLHYCLSFTNSKIVVLDAERADRLEPGVAKLAKEAGTKAFLVLDHQGKGKWEGMEIWDEALQNYMGDSDKILRDDPRILPEDNACIMFTSGTTGLPKGVLSTHRQYLSNVLNVVMVSRRAVLRRGEDIPALPEGPQKGILVSVPFFHVTGSTGLAMLASMTGLKVVLMRKWDAEEAARLIKEENVTVAGGVPSMVSDLMESSAAGYPLDSLMFGGAPPRSQLPGQAKNLFPTTTLGQAYGLTETNSIAVAIAGEDYIARPTSTGLPSPINDVLIVKDGAVLPPRQVGEIWLRGPNVMKEYWRDPEATAKAITKDGWFKSGDLGVLDEEGFLYVRDRLKDIIIRGGENIDSVSVENGLYNDPRILEAVVVGVPDKRLGELVAAFVCVKPAFKGQVTEKQLIETSKKCLPKFSVPVMIVVQDEPFERTPSGKSVKSGLRKLAKDMWEKRLNLVQTKL